MVAAFGKPNRVNRFGGTSAAIAANSTEPPSGKKDIGWVLDDEPPGSYWNWMRYYDYLWFRWFDERAFDGATVQDFKVKAPVPDTTADDGGDLNLEGGDAGTGADNAGGDAVVSGGAATGDKGSQVLLQAATKGTSGTGTRTPETYLECVGEAGLDGRVEVLKPLHTNGLSTTEPGIRASNAGGYGAEIVGQSTSPAYASLNIGSQNADPTTPATGNVYPSSVSGQLAHHNSQADPARFQNLDDLIKVTTADSTAITATSPTAFNQTATIPANSLRVGAVIDILAFGSYTAVGTPSLNFQFRLGGVSTSGTHTLAITAAGAGCWIAKHTIIIRSLGSSINFADQVMFELLDAALVFARAISASTLTSSGIDSGSPNTLELRSWWSASGNSTTMHGFIVSVK